MAKRSRSRGRGRSWRSAPRLLVRQWPYVLLALGLILVLYSGLNGYYYDRALQPSVTVPVTQETAQPSRPVRLTVVESPSVSVDGKTIVDERLEPQQYKDGTWTVSKDAGSYMNGSAMPGEKGNIIVYGHNKRGIFGPLLDLKGTERVTVTTKDGKKHRYRIVSLKEVTTDRIDVLAPTQREVLTVYTCSGWLDSRRFVVRAVPA